MSPPHPVEAAAQAKQGTPAMRAIQRASAVYCRGPLLDAVQRARIFDDAKHFVDMPMRSDPEDILSAFDKLPHQDKADKDRLRAFVDEHFFPPGNELVIFMPAGCVADPKCVKEGRVKDPQLRELAAALHHLWPTLCRKTAPSMEAAPHRSSKLPRAYPVVLPGGRFRETYYWDSFWICQGLLASGLVDVAQGLVQNLLDDVELCGFVPNGGRIYYLNRSQPPLLTASVGIVEKGLTDEQSKKWLPKAVATLKKEHAFWMDESKGRVVYVGDVPLNRFNADTDMPRPESYWQDLETGEGDQDIYREIAAAAESGWDFSSRWTRQGGRLKTGSEVYKLSECEATQILPVDLNAVMFDAEVKLAAMCEAVATGTRPPTDIVEGPADIHPDQFTDPDAKYYAECAKRRGEAFQRLFWRPELKRWADVWVPENTKASPSAPTALRLSEQAVLEADDAHNRAPTGADFGVAMWAGLCSEEQAQQAIETLFECGLMGPGGMCTTMIETGEQWDLPNGWPPLQALVIEGLRRSGGEPGKAVALDLAQRWVGTCYAAWRTTGFMHEKYCTTTFGEGGAGGEYEPQVGFGWSNAVVLELLAEYGDVLVAPSVEN
mmetsp:Transcript_62251/g.131588  ORF Transcript_62251/g.131588 Transcript_62251/m.131588 type:complete len:605 (+) Transcript_62251:124-1938(+)